MDGKIKCICYNILPELQQQTGIPCEHCLEINDVLKAIRRFNGQKIIYVCKAEDVYIQELRQYFSERLIPEVCVLGNTTMLDVKNVEMTIVDDNTNEQGLIVAVICSVIAHLRRDEMYHRGTGNYVIANQRANDILRLLKLIKNLI